MKLSILKSTLAFVVAITASYFVTSAVYADAYLRIQDTSGNKSHIPVELIDSVKLSELNTYFGGGAYPGKHVLSIPNQRYVALPGYQKRDGIFKLQKSTDGTKDGPRENLVMDTKEEAEDFCKYLAKTAGEFSDPAIVGGTVFASDWIGGIKEVIAVAYKADYQGDLIPAQKHVFCPNRWALNDYYWNKPDPKYFDENETTGVRASGFVNGNKNTYKVVCMNSVVAETTFTSSTRWEAGGHGSRRLYIDWTNGIYTYAVGGEYSTGEQPNLEYMNKWVGDEYCSGRRGYR